MKGGLAVALIQGNKFWYDFPEIGLTSEKTESVSGINNSVDIPKTKERNLEGKLFRLFRSIPNDNSGKMIYEGRLDFSSKSLVHPDNYF